MKITKKLLLSLGFIEENVNAEESGAAPYKYFVFNLKNEKTFLISCTDDECVEKNAYDIEFFDKQEIGKINDGKILIILCDMLKNMVQHD